MLGALLFGVDHLLASRAGDPHTIVVDAQVDAQAIAVFKEARGRAPNKEELYALRRVWLDNEVLYREGMALGLDRGDKAIRERYGDLLDRVSFYLPYQIAGDQLTEVLAGFRS